jgi:hypothetical protein
MNKEKFETKKIVLLIFEFQFYKILSLQLILEIVRKLRDLIFLN